MGVVLEAKLKKKKGFNLILNSSQPHKEEQWQGMISMIKILIDKHDKEYSL